MWEALKRMTKGKSSGPSKVTCGMFSNDVCVRELCEVANGLLMGESMPESKKRSMVVPLYKDKGNVLECGNYHTIKLLEHGMKVVEHVFEKRLRKMVEMGEEQCGFVVGKGTVDAIFMLRQLQEKYLENDNELYLVFVDLEKAFDRVPRVLIESSLRRKGVVECYMKALMKMYQEVLSQIKMESEDSKEFAVSVGIHQSMVSSFTVHLCCSYECGDRGGGK